MFFRDGVWSTGACPVACPSACVRMTCVGYSSVRGACPRLVLSCKSSCPPVSV
ncbi:hypothetical protein M6B38_360770 [Iris pallida]|uniref:Uncharacterized protein n=1 Tax=Iris pallida TaxID=29817 RepID=A0AAX6GJ17_IRIPA|nr:hypothetical protein M6B38_360770 [Iris pallida]